MAAFVRGRYNPFPPFDHRLFHRDRSMDAVKFVIETWSTSVNLFLYLMQPLQTYRKHYKSCGLARLSSIGV